MWSSRPRTTRWSAQLGGLVRGDGASAGGGRDPLIPWSFRNGRGEIVGLEADLAHALAVDLGLRLEIVPVGREAREQALAMQFSRPIAEEPWAFLVPDHERDLFCGLLEAKLDYWVRGKGARAEEGPRWSIGRDVLGWWR